MFAMDNAVRTTLGDLLYAEPDAPLVSEKDWVRLVRLVAAGDRTALYELYERTRDPVRTLLATLTGSGATANELAINVFQDVWRQAPEFEPLVDTVVGWIMKLARVRALDHVRLEGRQRGPAELIAAGWTVGEARAAWERLAARLPPVGRRAASLAPTRQWEPPDWKEVAPGIACKLLATDAQRDRVSMLVRLSPGADYPPHRHAGVEELHLLDGELWIDERKLYPGAYHRAERGTAEARFWSETGCSFVMITSLEDVLG